MIRVIHADVVEGLRMLPSGSVQCCITSPPYWALRNYGLGDKGIGLESTPEEYVAKLVQVFREVKRILRKDGTVFLNLGDSYFGSGKGLYRDGTSHGTEGVKQRTNVGSVDVRSANAYDISETPHHCQGLKPKDLVGIPWRVAFALQADGWWLRSDIIYAKPNPMPEPVTDRPTRSHEYVFLLAKSAKYFYDAEAVKEPVAWDRWGKQTIVKPYRGIKAVDMDSLEERRKCGRNRRDVWMIPSAPFKGAHFATFSPALVEPCVMAGTSERGCCSTCGAPYYRITKRTPLGQRDDTGRTHGLSEQRPTSPGAPPEKGWQADHETVGWRPSCKCGDAAVVPCTVLDPFAGSGTVGAVAKRLGCSAILIELQGDYLPLILKRVGEGEEVIETPPVRNQIKQGVAVK